MKTKTTRKYTRKVVLSPEATRLAAEMEDKGKEFNAQGQKLIEAARILRGENRESK